MFNWLLSHTPLLYFTQSLWRDEAFSVLVAEKPLQQVIGKLTFEPPVYYILLHYWIKLFGDSEIAVRSLSLVGFSLAVVVCIVWAEKLFRKHWLSWFLPVTFFLNPMLVYYAFEVRTYGWYMFFAILSLYGYAQQQWPLFVLAAVLGFYTHTYIAVFLFVLLVHWLVTHRKTLLQHPLPRAVLKDPMIGSCLVIGLVIALWLYKIAIEMGRLKESWYYPVDLHLVFSVLGNLFVGYEGTPWYGWAYTAILSVLLLAAMTKATRQTGHLREQAWLFCTMIALPLLIVLGISLVKPLFVNRYLIPVTIAQVFVCALALSAIRSPSLQRILAGVYLVGLVGISLGYPPLHPKVPIRNTMMQVNTLRRHNDVVFAASPLVFFESIYYSTDRKRVYLYNPDGNPFPWYVGDAIVSASQIASDLPLYPVRAFLVHEDGSYEVVYKTAATLVTNTAIKQ